MWLWFYRFLPRLPREFWQQTESDKLSATMVRSPSLSVCFNFSLAFILFRTWFHMVYFCCLWNTAAGRLHRTSQEAVWVPTRPLRAKAQEGGSFGPQAFRDCPEGHQFSPFLLFSLKVKNQSEIYAYSVSFECLSWNRLWVSRVRCLLRNAMQKRLSWRKREFYYADLAPAYHCVLLFILWKTTH